MANTYSQISIHSVFAVKGRENFILSEWRDDLHKYISGVITGKGAKSLAVGGWKDHVHIFFGMPVTTCISDFVGAVKAISSGWVNDNRLIKGIFVGNQVMEPFLILKVNGTLLSITLLIRKHIIRLKPLKKNI